MAKIDNLIKINSPLDLAYYRGNIVAVHHYNHKTLRYILFKRVDEKNFLPKIPALRIAPESYDAEFEVKRMEGLVNKINQAIIELSKTKTKEESIALKEIDEWIARSEKDSELKTVIPKAPKKMSFIEEFENWIEVYKKTKEQEAELSGNHGKNVNNTVKDFKSALNLLKDFQYDEFDDKPFYFDDINKDFLEKLIIYAHDSRGDEGDEYLNDPDDEEEKHKYFTKGNLSNKTLNKRFDSIFQFIRDYYKRLPNDVEKKPRLKTLERKIIRLDREELRELEQLEITDSNNTHYGYYRDCLLFLCYTGLRFGDFKKLNKTYYHAEDNEIVIDTQKTGKKCEIFLFDKAKEIGLKYDFDFKPRFMPTLYNQTLNRGIKEMLRAFDLFPEEIIFEYQAAERVTIKKPKREFITCHTGRRSYISIMLEHGMEVYDLISTTGHTNIEILNAYIDLFGKKRKEKFQRLNEALK